MLRTYPSGRPKIADVYKRLDVVEHSCQDQKPSMASTESVSGLPDPIGQNYDSVTKSKHPPFLSHYDSQPSTPRPAHNEEIHGENETDDTKQIQTEETIQEIKNRIVKLWSSKEPISVSDLQTAASLVSSGHIKAQMLKSRVTDKLCPK